MPLVIIQLSIVHPLSVKRGSKCFPTESGIKTRDRESNCEFSRERRNVCLSKGNLEIFQESFITHCSFICMFTTGPELSTVAKDLLTDLAWGISRFCRKSKCLFLYFNQIQKLIAYSFSLKSISCMLVI